MMLGNLSIDRIESRLSIQFPAELREYMEKNHQSNVSVPIAYGKWHCFDIPFTLVCGGVELTNFVYKHLAPLSEKMSGQIQISTAKIEKPPVIPE